MEKQRQKVGVVGTANIPQKGWHVAFIKKIHIVGKCRCEAVFFVNFLYITFHSQKSCVF